MVEKRKRTVTKVDEEPASPLEKIVTVDVEMSGNEPIVEEEPKEIKLDAVMAVESEPTKDLLNESKSSDPLDVTPEVKDNEKQVEKNTTKAAEVNKETKSEVPTKGELKEMKEVTTTGQPTEKKEAGKQGEKKETAETTE